MTRRRVALLLATVLLLLTAAPISAADGCPPLTSGYRPTAVNWDWAPGDSIPAADVLWETTLAGIEAEGEEVADHIAMFGFTTIEELYGFALEGWRSVDADGDGTVCLKLLPDHQNGQPAYVFMLGENNARAMK
jgi:hypothetical protein